MFRKRISSAALLLALSTPWSSSRGGEISFLEQFSLAPDRSVPLQQLVPGTEDYYYFQCLHLQQSGKFDQVEELLKPWIERHGITAGVREIQHRQALLTYPQNHRRSLEYIQRTFDLRYDWQRETVDQAIQLPTALDAERISRKKLLAAALSNQQDLSGLEPQAYTWLARTELNDRQRRDLLQRLTWPDLPNLPKLVVDDLNAEHSGGFGSHPIHSQMLLAQLDECLRLKPELLNESAFVQTYLTKLRPNDDVNVLYQNDEEIRYLDRMWSFVTRLSPVHNSLKAHVLYHRLVLDQKRGEYDKQRFLTYLRLPRPTTYVQPKYLERAEHRQVLVDLSQDFSPSTGLPPIQNDEPLVRALLQHFLVDAPNTKEFSDLIEDNYLKQLFAETKIVSGQGNPEQWASLLPPDQYQALKSRIDLDFASTNATYISADSDVHLDLFVKNVPTLIVKVYRINAANFYRDQNQPVSTAINLDGLVPNEEKTYQYTDPSVRRIKRSFDFPTLKDPGVYVIDFIGNGRSSRALIHKGQLHYVARIGAAGQMITVLDEKDQPAKDAAVWLGGRIFRPEASGEILIPFSTQPGQQNMVLMSGSLVTLDALQHLAESYELQAGIYVSRETLLSRQVAPVVIRPSLKLQGIPISIGALENPRIDIVSTDLDGTSTSAAVPDVKLVDGVDFTHLLRVPPRLHSLTITVSGQVTSGSENKKIDVAASETFRVHEIDQTSSITQILMKRDGQNYVLEILGKTGEPLPNRRVELMIKHRDFTTPVMLPLRSDEQGKIQLGTLTDIDFLTARHGDPMHAALWYLRTSHDTLTQQLHAQVGQTIELPFAVEPAQDQALSRADVSLLERRGNTFIADRFDALKLKDGMLAIEELEAGDYDLNLKREGRVVRIRVVGGNTKSGYAVGLSRKAQLNTASLIAIGRTEVQAETVQIQLRNASKNARVHVFAMHFMPSDIPFRFFAHVTPHEPILHPRMPLPSFYMQGRKIGDEYRYVLERKYARKFPGNMLPRPELLLNPWEVQETNTTQEELAAGEQFAPAAPAMGLPGMDAAKQASAKLDRGDFANLDFLPVTSYLSLNLKPDANGVVTIPRKDLRGERHLYVIAVDSSNTTQRTIVLPTGEHTTLDLRLAKGLDPAAHFSLQKQIAIHAEGDAFEIPNVGSGRFQMYDSLDRVFQLYETLLPGSKIGDFRFLTRWDRMTAEEKAEHYTKHASHELHFFLSRKDRPFFDSVVKPYLANKLHKTFMDHYLLEADLGDYYDPWSYSQLNVVERILLSQRIADERERVARDLAQMLQSMPIDQDRWNLLFDTALLGHAMDASVDERLQEQDVQEGAMFGGMGGGGGAPEVRKLLARRARGIALAAEDKSEVAAEAATAKEMADSEGRDATNAPAADAPTADDYALGDLALRGEALARRRFYQSLDATKEWAESNYYRLAIAEQNANLVLLNPFWADWARHQGDGPFRSQHFAQAARNVTEAVLALALLDLPFTSPEHKLEVVNQAIKVQPAGPIILVHEQIEKATSPDDAASKILVSQNFFRADDRHRVVAGQQVDKFVTDEFLTHVVYGGHIVVTNPTSTAQKLDLLIQIPTGALPVQKSKLTDSRRLQLEPYRTEAIEYYFYFPKTGDFSQFPVHVTQGNTLVASADPIVFHVVGRPSRVDEQSWEYVSQNADDGQVLRYLEEQDLTSIPLEKIAFRMADVEMYRKTLQVLRRRHVYHDTLWSYSVKHDDTPAIREFLSHRDQLTQEVGYAIDSPLLTLNPVARKSYEHLEYRPLVNARAHQVGQRRQILNDRFHQQYEKWLKLLSYHAQLTPDDQITTVYYLLLQDRIDEAVARLAQVNPDQLATRLQYDYCLAYLNMSQGKTDDARAIALKYQNYPVNRWREMFTLVMNHLDEIDGKSTAPVNPLDRNQSQDQLAANQPTLDLAVNGRSVNIKYRNLPNVQVRYYLMDIELLFSHNPFVQQHQGQFSYIAPNAEQTVELPANQAAIELQLPQELQNQNVLVEVEGAGLRQSRPFYSNDLSVQTMENYGQLLVTDSNSGKPLSTVYCKVYARMKDGQVAFYKDGYTDLRGRFDYTSLSTSQLDQVERFSILILSETQGAEVREVAPPKR